MKTLVYVEESENNLIDQFVQNKNLNLVLIRFSNCLSFSKEHIDKTKKLPVFILDKKKNLEDECNRFLHFVDENNLIIDYFYNDSEFNQELIQRFARHLSLPGALTENQARTVRDKVTMKTYINTLGLNCPDFKKIGSLYDAVEFGMTYGYPFIIKWREGVSSIEVYKIDSQQQLFTLNLDFGSEKYMAEKYCSDKIWCIDSLVSKGVVQNIFYTWLPYTNLSFAKEKERFIQLVCGKAPSIFTFSPEELSQKIISGLGLRNGYLHMEVFVSDVGEASVCEFAWRTPGDQIISNISILFDVDFSQLLSDAIFEQNVPPLMPVEKYVADIFLPLKDGIVEHITDFDELKKKCSIINGKINYRKGDIIRSKSKYTDSAGWVQIEKESIGEIFNETDKIYDAFELVVGEICVE